MIKKKLLIISIITFHFAAVYGQQGVLKKIIPDLNKEPDSLYKEIYKQDSIFFNAFNNCDTITYRKYLTDDFEFYHDLGGLHYLEEEMQSMREMCERNSHIRRQLIKNTLEVYKLGGYGALETGSHSFYHTNSGQSEEADREFTDVDI